MSMTTSDSASSNSASHPMVPTATAIEAIMAEQGTVVPAVLIPTCGEPKQVDFDTTPTKNSPGVLLGGSPTIVSAIPDINGVVIKLRHTDEGKNDTRLAPPLHRLVINGPILIVANDEEGHTVGMELATYQKYLSENPIPEDEAWDQVEEEFGAACFEDLMGDDDSESDDEDYEGEEGSDADDDGENDECEEDDDEDDDDEEMDEEEAKKQINEVLKNQLGMDQEALKERFIGQFKSTHARDPTETELENGMSNLLEQIFGVVRDDDDDKISNEEETDETSGQASADESKPSEASPVADDAAPEAKSSTNPTEEEPVCGTKRPLEDGADKSPKRVAVSA